MKKQYSFTFSGEYLIEAEDEKEALNLAQELIEDASHDITMSFERDELIASINPDSVKIIREHKE